MYNTGYIDAKVVAEGVRKCRGRQAERAERASRFSALRNATTSTSGETRLLAHMEQILFFSVCSPLPPAFPHPASFECKKRNDQLSSPPVSVFFHHSHDSHEKMRPTGFAALRSQAVSWTCRRCLRHRRGASFEAAKNTVRPNRRRYGNNGNNGGRSAVLLTATGGAVGAGALAFTDDVKHGYTAVQRSGRVLSTLALCINESVSALTSTRHNG